MVAGARGMMQYRRTRDPPPVTTGTTGSGGKSGSSGGGGQDRWANSMFQQGGSDQKKTSSSGRGAPGTASSGQRKVRMNEWMALQYVILKKSGRDLCLIYVVSLCVCTRLQVVPPGRAGREIDQRVLAMQRQVLALAQFAQHLGEFRATGRREWPLPQLYLLPLLINPIPCPMAHSRIDFCRVLETSPNSLVVRCHMRQSSLCPLGGLSYVL